MFIGTTGFTENRRHLAQPSHFSLKPEAHRWRQEGGQDAFLSACVFKIIMKKIGYKMPNLILVPTHETILLSIFYI